MLLLMIIDITNDSNYSDLAPLRLCCLRMTEVATEVNYVSSNCVFLLPPCCDERLAAMQLVTYLSMCICLCVSKISLEPLNRFY